jgi:hypothetical protein
MLARAAVRRSLRPGRAISGLSVPQPLVWHSFVPLTRNSSSVPSVTQPSFWAAMIPKPLRRSSDSKSKAAKPKSKEWNPATFFIVIFLLIGSMSIQMIALRNDFATFMRRADSRIELLKEVIERVQKGEDVDVEGLLGTGDPAKELEWEEGMLVVPHMGNCAADQLKCYVKSSAKTRFGPSSGRNPAESRRLHLRSSRPIPTMRRKRMPRVRPRSQTRQLASISRRMCGNLRLISMEI